MNVSVVFPILNEEEVIEDTITSAAKKIGSFAKNVELIAVNDGSTDGTKKILEKLTKKYSNLKIVDHQKNKGYGAALKSGIKNAAYDWIFFTDADMQFDFSELVSFAKHHKNYDFIVGFRKKRADSPRRIFVSYFYNKIIHSMFQLPLKDVDCAFKFMRKSALSGFEKLPDSFFVSAELMIRSIKKGYRIKEIGVTHLPRKKGVSKVTFRQIHKTVIDLTHLYREI